MEVHSCIFCKIIARQIPSDIIAETDDIIVIKDIQPKTSIHYLIIPKKHIPDIQSLKADDVSIAGNIIMMSQKLSSQLPNSQAFRLVSNNGSDAGQIIFHIHFHFLAGKKMTHF